MADSNTSSMVSRKLDGDDNTERLTILERAAARVAQLLYNKNDKIIEDLIKDAARVQQEHNEEVSALVAGYKFGTRYSELESINAKARDTIKYLKSNVQDLQQKLEVVKAEATLSNQKLKKIDAMRQRHFGTQAFKTGSIPDTDWILITFKRNSKATSKITALRRAKFGKAVDALVKERSTLNPSKLVFTHNGSRLYLSKTIAAQVRAIEVAEIMYDDLKSSDGL